MKIARRAALLGVLVGAWLVGSAPLVARQESAAVASQTLTHAQMEEFLLHARVGKTENASKGVTGTRRATLSDGRITHDASIQSIDVSKTRFEPDRGPVELNFRDSYRYNIAGYRLARLLELDNVPVSVERRVAGSVASVTWWIDDVIMDENDRVKRRPVGQLSSRAAGQIHMMRVFDELIANTDRNGGNMMWTGDGNLWMIDHSRAFRLDKRLRRPQLLERCDRAMFQKMRELTTEAVRQAAGDSLNRGEVEALLARRDEVVKLFEGMMAQRSEAAVFFTLPSR